MKKNNKKVFIYMDKEFPLDERNVFISGVYNGLKEFKKENPEYTPLVSYSAEELITLLQTQIKGEK